MGVGAKSSKDFVVMRSTETGPDHWDESRRSDVWELPCAVPFLSLGRRHIRPLPIEPDPCLCDPRVHAVERSQENGDR